MNTHRKQHHFQPATRALKKLLLCKLKWNVSDLHFAMSAPFMADSAAINSKHMTATVHNELLCFMISSLVVSTDPALLFCRT